MNDPAINMLTDFELRRQPDGIYLPFWKKMPTVQNMGTSVRTLVEANFFGNTGPCAHNTSAYPLIEPFTYPFPGSERKIGSKAVPAPRKILEYARHLAITDKAMLACVAMAGKCSTVFGNVNSRIRSGKDATYVYSDNLVKDARTGLEPLLRRITSRSEDRRREELRRNVIGSNFDFDAEIQVRYRHDRMIVEELERLDVPETGFREFIRLADDETMGDLLANDRYIMRLRNIIAEEAKNLEVVKDTNVGETGTKSVEILTQELKDMTNAIFRGKEFYNNHHDSFVAAIKPYIEVGGRAKTNDHLFRVEAIVAVVRKLACISEMLNECRNENLRIMNNGIRVIPRLRVTGMKSPTEKVVILDFDPTHELETDKERDERISDRESFDKAVFRQYISDESLMDLYETICRLLLTLSSPEHIVNVNKNHLLVDEHLAEYIQKGGSKKTEWFEGLQTALASYMQVMNFDYCEVMRMRLRRCREWLPEGISYFDPSVFAVRHPQIRVHSNLKTIIPPINPEPYKPQIAFMHRVATYMYHRRIQILDRIKRKMSRIELNDEQTRASVGSTVSPKILRELDSEVAIMPGMVSSGKSTTALMMLILAHKFNDKVPSEKTRFAVAYVSDVSSVRNDLSQKLESKSIPHVHVERCSGQLPLEQVALIMDSTSARAYVCDSQYRKAVESGSLETLFFVDEPTNGYGRLIESDKLSDFPNLLIFLAMRPGRWIALASGTIPREENYAMIRSILGDTEGTLIMYGTNIVPSTNVHVRVDDNPAYNDDIVRVATTVLLPNGTKMLPWTGLAEYAEVMEVARNLLKYPIYRRLVSPEAQEIIGKQHEFPPEFREEYSRILDVLLKIEMYGFTNQDKQTRIALRMIFSLTTLLYYGTANAPRLMAWGEYEALGDRSHLRLPLVSPGGNCEEPSTTGGAHPRHLRALTRPTDILSDLRANRPIYEFADIARIGSSKWNTREQALSVHERAHRRGVVAFGALANSSMNEVRAPLEYYAAGTTVGEVDAIINKLVPNLEALTSEFTDYRRICDEISKESVGACMRVTQNTVTDAKGHSHTETTKVIVEGKTKRLPSFKLRYGGLIVVGEISYEEAVRYVRKEKDDINVEIGGTITTKREMVPYDGTKTFSYGFIVRRIKFEQIMETLSRFKTAIKDRHIVLYLLGYARYMNVSLTSVPDAEYMTVNTILQLTEIKQEGVFRIHTLITDASVLTGTDNHACGVMMSDVVANTIDEGLLMQAAGRSGRKGKSEISTFTISRLQFVRIQMFILHGRTIMTEFYARFLDANPTIPDKFAHIYQAFVDAATNEDKLHQLFRDWLLTNEVHNMKRLGLTLADPDMRKRVEKQYVFAAKKKITAAVEAELTERQNIDEVFMAKLEKLKKDVTGYDVDTTVIDGAIVELMHSEDTATDHLLTIKARVARRCYEIAEISGSALINPALESRILALRKKFRENPESGHSALDATIEERDLAHKVRRSCYTFADDIYNEIGNYSGLEVSRSNCARSINKQKKSIFIKWIRARATGDIKDLKNTLMYVFDAVPGTDRETLLNLGEAQPRPSLPKLLEAARSSNDETYLDAIYLAVKDNPAATQDLIDKLLRRTSATFDAILQTIEDAMNLR